MGLSRGFVDEVFEVFDLHHNVVCGRVRARYFIGTSWRIERLMDRDAANGHS
jgi:hypothetical protein